MYRYSTLQRLTILFTAAAVAMPANIVRLLACSSILAASVRGSSNGCLWECDVATSGDNANQCVFAAQSQNDVTACDAELEAISHVVTSGAVPDGCRPGSAVALSEGKCDVRRASDVATGTCGSIQLGPSPMPLSNGDCAVVLDDALTSDLQLAWSSAMIYGLLLREKVLFFCAVDCCTRFVVGFESIGKDDAFVAVFR